MSATARTRALAIVPVRVSSQRLPRKALLRESGKPLFLHTCDRARMARNIDEVWVATDDGEVAEAAEDEGLRVARTSSRPRTGSERCAEALSLLQGDFVLDIQGDWPEIDPEDLDAMVDQLRAGVRCNTLAARLDDEAAAGNPEVVKVVRGLSGKALYFSRAKVPFVRHGPFDLFRHIGVYGFERSVLLSVPGLPSSGLAEAESLEQLRFLENDIPIHVLEARGSPWGIETRSDYDAFLTRLRA
ncbi:MAG: 3-deoxy-manno-octulosonate cytidylyltransferase [Planctomycetota bacterium]